MENLYKMLFVYFVAFAGCSSEYKSEKENEPLSGREIVTEVFVSNPDIRSCDISFVDGNSLSKADVRFSASVVGQYQYRYPTFTVAFSSNSEAPMEENPFEIISKSQDEGNTETMRIESARCYTAEGTLLEEPGIELR